jgi:hypothetical protein
MGALHTKIDEPIYELTKIQQIIHGPIKIPELPDDIIYEIIKRITFTYISFLELFVVSKKINIFMKSQCMILGLNGLIICTKKCSYNKITYFKPNSERVIYDRIYGGGRKYNTVHMEQYSSPTCITHHSGGITKWTCSRCKKNKTRPRATIVFININAYKHNRYDIPSITDSLNDSKEYLFFKTHIFQNVKKVQHEHNLDYYSACMTKRDYYYWKGPILQGIDKLQCIDCGDRSFETICTVCNVKFDSTYHGKADQLCEICLQIKLKI